MGKVMAYAIFYKGKKARYPIYATEGEAWQDLKNECAEAGEDWEDWLNEGWPSPRGVEKCLQVRKVATNN